jgi:hypothetical protein
MWCPAQLVEGDEQSRLNARTHRGTFGGCMNSDLIETIVTAAVAAIRNQEPAIVNGTGALRSLTVEVEVAGNGQVVNSTA